MSCWLCENYQVFKENNFIIYENDSFFSVLNTQSGNVGDSLVCIKENVKSINVHDTDIRVILRIPELGFKLSECVEGTLKRLISETELREELYRRYLQFGKDKKSHENIVEIFKNKTKILRAKFSNKWRHSDWNTAARTNEHYHLHISPHNK